MFSHRLVEQRGIVRATWLRPFQALLLTSTIVGIGALAPPAHAQVGSGTIVGTVTDASTKGPVADVVVTVTSPALQGEEIAVTGKNGDFRITSLPPGDYTIRMDKETYRPYSRGGVRVRADVTLRVDTQLLPEALKTDIVVVARSPTVDVGSATTGSTVDSEFAKRVPIIRPSGKGSETRSVESAASSAPQAKADDYGTSIAGTTSPENNYVLDGLTINDPAYGTLGTPVTVEFVEALNVITGGYLPEYGKSTGGILNVVTKSGGDEFSGSIWGFYTPGALVGPRKNIRRAGDTIDTQVSLGDMYDFGFDVGGAIIKEKLWFYLGIDYAVVQWDLKRSLRSLDYQKVDPTCTANCEYVEIDDGGFSKTTLIDGTTENFEAVARTLQVFGKLTYRVSKSNRLALSILAAPRWSGGDGEYGIDGRDGVPEVGALVGAYETLAHNYDGLSFDTVLKWNADIVDNELLFEASVGWHHQEGGRLPSDGSAIGSNSGLAGINSVIWRRTNPRLDIRDFETLPVPSICDAPADADPELGIQPCPLQTYFNGGPDFISEETLERVGARAVLTWLPEAAGQHVLKLGTDFDFMTFDHNRAYSGGTRYREGLSGASFTDNRQYGYLVGPDDYVILDNLRTDVDSISLGAFLQDSWTIGGGFTLNLGVRWDAQWMQNADGETVIALANQWSPRVGFVWDPTMDGGAKIFANLALFFESIPLDIADRAGSGDPQITSVKSAAGCDPSDPESAETGCLDDANRLVITGPSSPDRKWVITGAGITPVDPDLEAQSSWELVAGAEYDLGRITDLMEDLRVGLLYTRRWMNNVIEDMSRDEATTYFIGNPGSGIAKDFPEATRNYDAVTLYFMKEFSQCWLLQASYTLSWLKGNYAGLFRPETLQLDPNINSDFDLRSLTINREGYLPGDSRHQFKIFGAHDFELAKGHNLQFGYGFRLGSGGPTNYLGSHILYGSDEVFILPRGSGERLPWVGSIDLSLGYEVAITESFSLTITAEIFNLFNFQAITSKSERYTNADVEPIPGGDKSDLDALVDIEGTNLIEGDLVNPNFGNPTSYQRPRTFRFGIRGTL
ncbi:MAG: TonB-dependent receptor [Deltaproteobacteria bacterium]|nr:TonB-dependent receptor [Deltaproteobacteria bacterium]